MFNVPLLSLPSPPHISAGSPPMALPATLHGTDLQLAHHSVAFASLKRDGMRPSRLLVLLTLWHLLMRDLWSFCLSLSSRPSLNLRRPATSPQPPSLFFPLHTSSPANSVSLTPRLTRATTYRFTDDTVFCGFLYLSSGQPTSQSCTYSLDTGAVVGSSGTFSCTDDVQVRRGSCIGVLDQPIIVLE